MSAPSLHRESILIGVSDPARGQLHPEANLVDVVPVVLLLWELPKGVRLGS